MLLNEKLKELRNESNLSQTELATKLNVSKSCVASHEQGSRGDADTYILKFAKYFNVSIDYLYGISSSPTSDHLNYGGSSNKDKDELIELIKTKNLSKENILLIKNLIESLK